ncbi:MAG TPA: hypothetical protein ENK31_02135 [Nannocystis exedens]|nr:hypothetical protein [Nannocystis exedens]
MRSKVGFVAALGFGFGFGLGFFLLGGGIGPSQAAEPPAEPSAELAPAESAEPEVPNWRFRRDDRPVKVIFLAGSIGAWPRDPYSKRIEGFCRNIEAKNLSKTGFGALALKQRFKSQVLKNRRVRLGRGDDENEYWLVFQGGLNSVAMPENTNHHIRELYALAHSKGIKVVGFTLTPWGDESDRRRWSGIGGLLYLDFTRKLVDFTLGRADPAEALGSYASKRKVAADAPWDPGELPDIAVDLYEAPYLRSADAPLREIEPLRRQLERDKGWKKRLKAEGLSDDERAARLDAEAARAAQIPRWFLREELRSFDHIHPNGEGHLRIAQLACPQLPESWGCECPELPAGAVAASESRSAVEQVLLPFYPAWVGDLLRLLNE